MELSTRISPNYTVADWDKLNLDNEEDWQKGIKILEDRIRRRFLTPICMIEHYEFAGFAVMALDCLLIETLQQFCEGVSKTPDRKSKEYFVRFLTKTSFGEWFTKEMAETFYEQIRNGILHQAETKGSSLIRIDTPELVTYTEDGKGLFINRRLFHQQLVKEFESYLNKLRDPSEQELRTKFKKKMDYICRLS